MPDLVRALARDYLICLSFYSRLPLRRLARMQAPWSMAEFAAAARLAPLAGATIGAVAAAALVIAAAVLDLPAMIAAALALSAQLLASGALHEDGLADVADGFGGGATRERKLDIMRDSRIGTFGALALILGTLLKVAALATVLDRAGAPAAGLALAAAAAASRGFGLIPLATLPPARPDGLAQAAGRVRPGTLIVACALALGFGALPAGFGRLRALARPFWPAAWRWRPPAARPGWQTDRSAARPAMCPVRHNNSAKSPFGWRYALRRGSAETIP